MEYSRSGSRPKGPRPGDGRGSNCCAWGLVLVMGDEEKQGRRRSTDLGAHGSAWMMDARRMSAWDLDDGCADDGFAWDLGAPGSDGGWARSWLPNSDQAQADQEDASCPCSRCTSLSKRQSF